MVKNLFKRTKPELPKSNSSEGYSFYDPDNAAMCFKKASNQNAIDLASRNWITNFSKLGLNGTGGAGLYPDLRIDWLVEHYGALTGKSILELGSLEGAHSLRLAELGSSKITAVEANEAHFLKSLIISNALELRNVQFMLGDFQSYMNETSDQYDLVFASGILYHLTNPAELIASASKVSDSIFLWTVLYDDESIPNGHKNLISGKVPLVAEGFQYQGYKHHYRAIDPKKAKKDKNFSGGLDSYAIWLEHDELIRILKHFGYSKITEKHVRDNPRHGGNVQLLATKE